MYSNTFTELYIINNFTVPQSETIKYHWTSELLLHCLYSICFSAHLMLAAAAIGITINWVISKMLALQEPACRTMLLKCQYQFGTEP